MIELTARGYCLCKRSKPQLLLRSIRNCSTTPLGGSAIFNNEGILTFLLMARADPDIRNNRGLRPIDFAGSDRILSILQDPSPYISRLECLLQASEPLVTERF